VPEFGDSGALARANKGSWGGNSPPTYADYSSRGLTQQDKERPAKVLFGSGEESVDRVQRVRVYSSTTPFACGAEGVKYSYEWGAHISAVHLVRPAFSCLEIQAGATKSGQVLQPPLLRSKQTCFLGGVSGRTVGSYFGTGTQTGKGRAAFKITLQC